MSYQLGCVCSLRGNATEFVACDGRCLKRPETRAEVEAWGRPAHPTIVCLCGSTRFNDAFHAANLSETLAGRIVLTIGCDFKSDDALGLGPEAKERLDELHLRKIDLADEILVLNVGGYLGESTKREIAYAHQYGKRVRWLEEPNWSEHELE